MNFHKTNYALRNCFQGFIMYNIIRSRDCFEKRCSGAASFQKVLYEITFRKISRYSSLLYNNLVHLRILMKMNWHYGTKIFPVPHLHPGLRLYGLGALWLISTNKLHTETEHGVKEKYSPYVYLCVWAGDWDQRVAWLGPGSPATVFFLCCRDSIRGLSDPRRLDLLTNAHKT